MAVARWMIPNRSLRSGRPHRSKFGNDEDFYKLDPNKNAKENALHILQALCTRTQDRSSTYNLTSITSEEETADFKEQNKCNKISDGKRLSYLNAFVKLLSKDEVRSNIGFSTEELLCCLRICLVHETTYVRAATLRVVRYILRSEADVITFNTLRLSYLITRSLDIVLRNEVERAQALRVIRRALVIAPNRISPTLVRCLSSIAGGTGVTALASGGSVEGSADRLSRACVATLAEIGVLNTPALAWCGGAAALARHAAACDQPHMAEAACGVLLHALETRNTRRAARVDLRCLAAPYADFHDRTPLPDKNRDEREMRFTCSRLSLLCVLRSWPGLLHFCHPLHHSGLRALVDVLYLNQLEVRNAILDLLYELLGLPQPEWTDEMSVALAAVDPSDFQDSWRLNEGFIVSEGLSILPHLSATGPDITEIHMALLLYCFLESGLLDALIEVIVTSDTFISVRATVLLGQLLYLIHLLLPPEVCSVTPALPSLLAHAASGEHRALAAVAALQSLHSMLEARPACSSLFLNHVIQYCAGLFARSDAPPAGVQSPKSKCDVPRGLYRYREDSFDLLNDADYEAEEAQRRSFGSKNDYSNRNSRNESVLVKSKSVSSRTSAVVNKVAKSTKFFNLFDKECDNLIRDSNVLQTKDGFSWDWCVIRAILKRNIIRWNEYSSWWRCIITYLRPSSNQFSHADAATHPRDATLAVLEVVPVLHADPHPECRQLLRDLFADIVSALRALLVARSAHECLFSPQHMTNTMCQMYFLIIAQLCHDSVGLQLFYDIGLYDILLKLTTTTHHSCYVKLIISSLDYTIDSYPRQIMSETLQCDIEPSRLYATQFLNVLLRARQKAAEMTKKKVLKVENTKQWMKNSPYNGDLNSSSINHDPQTICSNMDSWVLDLLVKQTSDESKAVSRCALSALEEACNVPAYLDHLVPLRSKIRSLFINNQGSKEGGSSAQDPLNSGDRAYLLWLRLASAPQAFDEQEMSHEITFWANTYNDRYACLVESGAHAALTLGAIRGGASAGRGGGDAVVVGARGTGVRGATGAQSARIPVHLYTLLSSSPNPAALSLLHKKGKLAQLLQCMERGHCDSPAAVTSLKGAIWACCAAVAGGSAVVNDPSVASGDNRCGINEASVATAAVTIVRLCSRYSVRAAALHALGMLASVRHSADVLQRMGWLSVRHTRHDRFPIIQDDNWQISRSEEDLYNDVQYGSPTKGGGRRVVVDTENSETSDKTDRSNADSADSNRNDGRITTSVTIEHSAAEERCEICETVDDQRSSVDVCDRAERRAKCQTLPQRPYAGSKRHQRSLSESKTVDKFKTDDESSHLIYERSFHIGPISENRPTVGRMNSFDQWHDGMRRIRNNSESSTSGVSSCDSVYGKYTFNDRVLTLSPIPSSSSLSAIKGSAPRRRQPEGQRRISLQSYTGSDAAGSPPSQKDLAGYATLKSLSRHRRPHYSESEVKGADELNAFLTSESRRPSAGTASSAHGAFASLRERRQQTHTSLLKYDWKPLSTPDVNSTNRTNVASVGITELLQQSGEKTRPRPQQSNTNQGFCYIGICLPRRLLDIFPDDDDDLDDEMDCILGVDNSLTLDMSGTSIGTKIALNIDGIKGSEILETYRREAEDSTLDSSMSDVSGGAAVPNMPGMNSINMNVPASGSTKRRRQWTHDTFACLLCCRTKPASTAELREAFFAGMEAPKSGADRASTLKSPSEGGATTNAHSDASCGSPASAGSSASKYSDIGGNRAVTADILKHAERMGNPVWHRQSKQTLLSLKQRYPDSFQSVCLYSEICKLVTLNTYRVSARRFLQELFFDLNFDVFFGEPLVILQMKTVSATV